MTLFLSYLINGISLGSVYAIIALGYTMVYGIAKMLNFAHGDVIMIGAYVSFCAMQYLGLPALVSVVLAMVACTALGIVIEGLAYKPLRQAPSLAVLITAIGVLLFFPKNSRDWTIDILVGVGLIFFIPLFFSLAISNRLVLAFTFFVYVGALFTVYLYLLHKYMLKFAGVNEEVEELRKQIRINNKNKQLMTNRIKKSQDETGYNLGSFDDKITSIQQVMQNTVEKRQEALENFESEIRHQITADITAANKDELLGLQQEFESKRQELSDKKEEIEQIEKQLKEEYEPVFGKDLLYKQRLNKFDSFCQENADLSLEEEIGRAHV